MPSTPPLRIAVNTTSTIAGGTITHLRHLLPALEKEASGERVAVIGDVATLEKLGVPSSFEMIELPPAGSGFASRLRCENFVLPRILRSWKADVLFHPGNFAVFRSPIPQVILIHNLAPFLDEVIRGESVFQRARLQLLKQLTNKSLKQVACAIFISAWGRELVLGNRLGAETLDAFPVIPFGAEHLGGHGGAESSDILAEWNVEPDAFVLTVSHIYRYKRLEKLIDAYVALGERASAWPLLIVGEPFDREYAMRLQERAEKSVAPIVFTGGLDARALASLMSNARVFAFTSEAENLPITLLEAMSAGSAIVTNRACSMPEVCGDAAAYVDPSTASEYRRVLDHVLHDDTERALMRERSLARASEYRWSDSARATLYHLRTAAMGN